MEWPDPTPASGDPSSQLAERTAPVRILVQTATHLVPGDLYPERLQRMQDIIYQYHWNRDFDHRQDRFYAYGDEFGHDHRVCYFLLDSGIDMEPANPSPPILWYRWIGESLVAIQRTLPPQIESILKQYPFEKQPSKFSKPKKQPLDSARCRTIKLQMDCKMPIAPSTIQYLREHPDKARKLKDDLEPRFWSRLEAFANSQQGGSRPLLEYSAPTSE